MLQHTLESGQPSVSLNGFKILGKGFNNNWVKRKISESLLIKQYWPTLNTQENSISLNKNYFENGLSKVSPNI